MVGLYLRHCSWPPRPLFPFPFMPFLDRLNGPRPAAGGVLDAAPGGGIRSCRWVRSRRPAGGRLCGQGRERVGGDLPGGQQPTVVVFCYQHRHPHLRCGFYVAEWCARDLSVQASNIRGANEILSCGGASVLRPLPHSSGGAMNVSLNHSDRVPSRTRYTTDGTVTSTATTASVNIIRWFTIPLLAW